MADLNMCKLEEVLIYAIADQLAPSKHVAIGAASPIPAAAALLAKHQNPALEVSLLGNEKYSTFTDGGRELFDCAAQGRIDTFFLSGVQIDGHANINLIGTGPYPTLTKRFAGSFGSAYLYHLIPNIILFCWSHQPEALVKQVDFISAAGPTDDGVYRTGGPTSLITDKCIFSFDTEQRQFRLTHLHPNETAKRINELTGFNYLHSESLLTTDNPPEEVLAFMRSGLSTQMSEVYPQFADKIWNR